MSTSKVEIQDGSGNVYYPKTSIDSVIYSDNTSIEEKIRMLETKLNELKSRLVDSINDKTGSSLTSNSTVDEMAAIINSIKTLEQATADANATASNILVDKTAYVNGAKITGTMPNKGTVTQSLSANGSLTLPKGYYDSIKVKQSVTTKGGITDAVSHGTSGNYIYTRIPQGAYFTNASTGYPEIKSNFSDIANAVGLTPDKIVGTVGGITGTVTQNIPLLNPNWNDIHETDQTKVGQHMYNNGANYALLKVPNGHYINGCNWVGAYTPDLRPENIVAGKNVLGVNGSATISSLGGCKLFYSEIKLDSSNHWRYEYPANITPICVYNKSPLYLWLEGEERIDKSTYTSGFTFYAEDRRMSVHSYAGNNPDNTTFYFVYADYTA